MTLDDLYADFLVAREIVAFNDASILLDSDPTSIHQHYKDQWWYSPEKVLSFASSMTDLPATQLFLSTMKPNFVLIYRAAYIYTIAENEGMDAAMLWKLAN